MNPSPAPEWPAFAADEHPLDVIVKLSRFYGADPSIVLAGGGNTSCKIDDLLFVKGSGTALATMTAEGFVKMDRNRLQELADATLDEDPVQREAQYKQAIMGAQCEPEKGQRPSVEALLHHLLSSRYVVHSHATLVNMLTCAHDGERWAQELFGDDIVWVPYVDPGFILAQTLKRALAEHRARTGRAAPRAVLMANHGLIVAGDDPETVRENTRFVLDGIAQRLGPDWQREAWGPFHRLAESQQLIQIIAPALRGLLAEPEAAALKIVTCDDSDLVLGFAGTEAGKTLAAGGPLCPDQIVYCNSYPLWFEPAAEEGEQPLIERLRGEIARHTTETGFAPKVVLVRGVGLFAAGDDFKLAQAGCEVYRDAIQVMAGATRLGGGHAAVRPLSDQQRRFIEDWEVEAYRRKAAAASMVGRLAGKVVVVTGAAQGFGYEIAGELAAEGAVVVLTDINQPGVLEAARNLQEQYGPARALGLPINVTQRESVAECLRQVVRTYGGFDVFLSNAGVLKAASVKTQDKSDFQFVTDVNYKGYFFCVQKAAPVLARQRLAKPGYTSDIIQINSKSGLVGSNRNGAYAGSKFGGIGLTQSFALELIEDGIKVNAICPGNFFDGPLWSDPENGLFAQYLRTGKVEGARTVQDVRRAYEAKVPMGRGCSTPDVVRAILYVIEQQYETGQALPVTGGQVMLS